MNISVFPIHPMVSQMLRMVSLSSMIAGPSHEMTIPEKTTFL